MLVEKMGSEAVELGHAEPSIIGKFSCDLCA
jgi:hypothetical protein